MYFHGTVFYHVDFAKNCKKVRSVSVEVLMVTDPEGPRLRADPELVTI
jgi:hypothetical protein